jgi:hypothetical protein
MFERIVVARRTRPGTGLAPTSRGRLHVHRFRWDAEEPFGNGSRYACSCGAVRAGF